VCGYVSGGSNAESPQKFGNCPFICIFSWRERLLWLGYDCITYPGKGSDLIFLQDSYDNSSELPVQCCSCCLGERRASI
jgi:hypothetical protein